MSVYVWGSNKCQQLIGQKGLHCYAPAHVVDQFDGQTPIQVAAGDGHTLVLCESGDIYSFGRGKEGQLGHDLAEVSTSTSSHSHIVGGLEHETVVKIAAGSLTSYAITSAGEVYHWGLIHRHVHEYKDPSDADGVNEAVQAGKLTGIAQEQLNTVVEVDTAARAHATSGVSRRGGRPAQSRQLRDIVRDSTERWMMPTDDAEQEYLEELRAMGYQNEDVEERMQSRGREYHGMLAMGCSRQIQAVPRLITGLGRDVRIVEVSAGYAHVMLLSDQGRLYAAGYNDRGQLGLGHRINTSEFKHVDFLANKFVVQVVCGQQHTLCRVVDRVGHGSNSSIGSSSSSSSGASSGGVDPSEVYVGSGVGADVYVWGNGVLGQLGIGRRGTSKGRLLPTLLATMHALYPRGVIDVAAGSNFSALVTIDGSVYSFGHAEYNQHGTGNKSYKDYVDPYFYFEPRVMQCFDNSELTKSKAGSSSSSSATTAYLGQSSGSGTAPVRMRSLSCGAVFTVGVDEVGNLHSWGWNDSGVLGHGFNHFASSAMQINSIGKSFDGCRVVSVSAGSKHVIVLTQTQGNPWALTFKSLLEAAPYADVLLHVGGGSGVAYPCHRSILSCRSRYFQGFILAGEKDAREERLYQHLLLHCQDERGAAAANDDDDGEEVSSDMLHITLHSQYANASTVKSLLEYLYLDRIHIPFHKRRELLHLAEDLNISRLATALEADFASARYGSSSSSSSVVASPEMHPVADPSPKGTSAAPPAPHAGAPSFFINDLAHLFNSTAFCDIVFVDGPTIPSIQGVDETRAPAAAAAGSHHSLPLFRREDHCFSLFAHKVIVSRIPYFEALITGHFSESTNFVTVMDNESAATATAAATVAVGGEEGGGGVARTALCVDVSGLQMDDISIETFVAVIRYAYTGRLSELPEGSDGVDSEDVDMGLVMAALVAANRLNFALLTQHCERVLSLHIGEYFPHNAENCLSFAVSYNFPRLERQCLKVLKRS